MMTLEQAFHLAVQHQQAGRLAEAETLYRQILAAHPDHPDALHLLGTIAQHAGRADLAVEWIQRSLSFQPNFAAAHYNLGNALRELGRLEEAIAAYRRAVELQPDFADAHYNLGVVLKEHGESEAAMAAYHRAMELRPGFADALDNLGIVLKECGRFEEAVGVLRRAVELKPQSAETYNNLGQALAGDERMDEAMAAYRHALEINPDLAAAHYNLGDVLRSQGQFDEAIVAYRRALELKPDYAEACNNLGVVFKARGQSDEAMAAFRWAVELQPDYADGYMNLGAVLHERGQLNEAMAAFHRSLDLEPDQPETHLRLGMAFHDARRFEDAIAAHRRALELKPQFAEAHNNLGNALRRCGEIDKAIAAYRRALELKPDLAAAHNNLGTALGDRGELDAALAAFRRSLEIDAEQASVHSNLIFALHSDPRSDVRAIREEQQCWWKRFGEPLRRFIVPHANDRNPDRRLRIGYVSSDFHDHVAGRNVLPLLASHDHRRFEIVCYSGVVAADELTGEFRRYADLWRDTAGTTDEALAEMIRSDDVDILVDLVQHSANNRLPAFARQPAPLQVSFAGYPEDTGLETIEYRISDRWLESARGEGVFLIDSFWCYDPHSTQLESNDLPVGERGCVTFGCLSNFSKLNEPMLRVWARLLGQVENSRLGILCGEGSHRERTRQLFQQEGIEAHRVEFFSWRARTDYLALYHRLDIVLDPFPYNGHTTSLDALWMGVPVVTLAGKTCVSRGGLSILSNVGVPELVAHSTDEYLALASRLACDLPRLRELRQTLRSRMESSVLMDAARFAQSIEAAYRAMWQRWCAQQDGAR